MFFTRLNSTASAWKSSEVAHALQRLGEPPRPERRDVGRRRHRADDLDRITPLLEREPDPLDRERRAPDRSRAPAAANP